MLNCTVKFDNENWTLCFAPEKAFYQIPAQSKIAELEDAAKEFSGRRITITLSVAAAPQKPAPAKATRTKTKPAVTSAKKTEILDEEPLAQGPFQASNAAAQTGTTPDEVKDILDVSPGELLA